MNFIKTIAFFLCASMLVAQSVPLRNPQIQGSSGSIISGATLTNNGTLVNAATLTNSGTISGAGTFNFGSGTVTFPAGSITSGNITDGAIVNADINASAAIDISKLASSAITIAGTSTSLGGSITASAILDSISSTQGTILYRGASGWSALSPGTSGHFLKSQGAGANPMWDAAAGSGSVATDAIWDAAGDLAVGTGANTAARLAIGANGYVLTSNGTTASWAAPSAGISGLTATRVTFATGATTIGDDADLTFVTDTLSGTALKINATATTAATNSTSGALIVAGGAGISKDSWINGIRVGRGGGSVGSNTAMGAGAMAATATGVNNVAVGENVLSALLGGNRNMMIGYEAGKDVTSGSENAGAGNQALYTLTTGNYNSGFGAGTLSAVTTASSNTALGYQAGTYRNAGLSTLLVNPSNSIYIGDNAIGNADSETNAIVIGSAAIGEGSNKTVIGNSSTTQAHLFGTLLTDASATSRAGFRLPHGAAPSSPLNGDMWTTSAGGLYARINGGTISVTPGAYTLAANPAFHFDAARLFGANGARLADGDAVSTWPDISGNGLDVANTSTARPIYHTDRLNDLPGVTFDGTNDVLTRSTYTSSATDYTLIIVASHSDSSLRIAVGGGASHYTGWQTNNVFSSYDGTSLCYDANAAFSSATPALSSPCIMVARNATTGRKVWLNRTEVGTASGSTKSLTFSDLGAFNGGYFWKGDVYEVIGYDRALTDQEISDAVEALERKWGAKRLLLVADGNSLTSGAGGVDGWPYYMRARLSPYTWTTLNYGVTSQTTTDMAGDAATQIDAYSGTENWCVAWEVRNDLFFGATMANAKTTFQTYCEDRRSAGFKVCVVTLLPAGDYGTGNWSAVNRAAFNTWLKANYTTFADAIYKPDEDGRIGDEGDEADTTYFQVDQIHLNATGATVIASGILAALGLEGGNEANPPGVLDLTTGVTGTLPVANGGTGASSLTNLITLATHTTGNYVADVAGTANEITSTHTPGEGSTATLSLPATIDLGGKTSFEIPNGAAPTVDAFGEIAGDNDLWAASRGAPVFFDGTAATALVNVLVSDTPSNGQVPVWNTGGTITWETNGSGSVATDTIWDAKGDLAGGTGSNTAARLPVGTNGYVLTADSAETTGMKWAAASGGSGNWVLVSTTTISGTPATIDFDVSTGYRRYRLELDSVICGGDGYVLYMRTSTDGGSTYDSGGSDYNSGYGPSATYLPTQVTSAQIETGATIGADAGEGWSGEIDIYEPGATTNRPFCQWSLFGPHYSSGAYNILTGGARRATAADIDHVRLLFQSANTFLSGKIRLFRWSE